MAPVIFATDLSKSFGKYCIIDSLSLQVEAGSIYGLVGLNGAGKTTLLRLLLGILQPDRGTIRVMGRTPWHHDRNFYRQCGVVLESDGFWGNLTAAENCAIYASVKGVSPRELADYLAATWKDNALFTGNKKVKHFSRGERMQCALCRAFIGQASVYFLDEPAVALDLHAYDHFKDLVRNARQRGAALIISSHQLDTIDELCDRVGILRDGTLTEIDRSSRNAGVSWYIDTEDSPTVNDVLVRAGGTSVRFEGGWHFSIDDAATNIPAIIGSLVALGCAVREVRREEHDFGSAIRMLYAGRPRREAQ
ncbi:MAG: ABC transporter ATP-binding protein [Chitinispirillaceae bacterium]|nr:ABC transporter ATP-binding protein [Chitinispirillaceae bacterium]